MPLTIRAEKRMFPENKRTNKIKKMCYGGKMLLYLDAVSVRYLISVRKLFDEPVQFRGPSKSRSTVCLFGVDGQTSQQGNFICNCILKIQCSTVMGSSSKQGRTNLVAWRAT